MTLDKTHLYMIGGVLGLMLLTGIVVSGGWYIYSENKAQASRADAIHEFTVKEVTRLEKENQELKDQQADIAAKADKAVAAKEQEKQQVTRSSQDAIRYLETQLGEIQIHQPTMEEVTAAQKRGDKLFNSPGAIFTADQVVAEARRENECQQKEILLTACTAQGALKDKLLANKEQEITHKDADIAEQRKVARPGFWRSTGRFIKVALPAVVAGIIVGKIGKF